jgi:hypothetical protein
MKMKLRKTTALLAFAMVLVTGLWWRSHQPSSHNVPTAAAARQTGPIDPPPSLHESKAFPPASNQMATTPIKTVDVCGVGKVAIDGPRAAKAEAELDAKMDKDLLRWRDALLNSSDVRARAAGLFVDGRIDTHSFGKAPSQQALESLVQLEHETNDPAIYAIALAACDAVKTPIPGSSCESISRQGWSKLEPDNAAPWLEIAGVARATHDTAAENAAFAEAIKADKIDGYNYSLFGFAEPDMPTDMSPLERSQLSIWMIGMDAAMYSPLMPATVASRHCSAENVKNDAVRGECNQLAELMVKVGTTLVDLAIGTAIGARTGWPEARVAALTEEKEALQGVWVQAEPQPGRRESEFGCETALRRNYMLHERAQLGEIAAARQAINLSGRTNLELSQSYQEYLSKLMHGADQLSQSPSP